MHIHETTIKKQGWKEESLRKCQTKPKKLPPPIEDGNRRGKTVESPTILVLRLRRPSSRLPTSLLSKDKDTQNNGSEDVCSVWIGHEGVGSPSYMAGSKP